MLGLFNDLCLLVIYNHFMLNTVVAAVTAKSRETDTQFAMQLHNALPLPS